MLFSVPVTCNNKANWIWKLLEIQMGVATYPCTSPCTPASRQFGYWSCPGRGTLSPPRVIRAKFDLHPKKNTAGYSKSFKIIGWPFSPDFSISSWSCTGNWCSHWSRLPGRVPAELVQKIGSTPELNTWIRVAHMLLSSSSATVSGLGLLSGIRGHTGSTSSKLTPSFMFKKDPVLIVVFSLHGGFWNAHPRAPPR